MSRVDPESQLPTSLGGAIGLFTDPQTAKYLQVGEGVFSLQQSGTALLSDTAGLGQELQVLADYLSLQVTVLTPAAPSTPAPAASQPSGGSSNIPVPDAEISAVLPPSQPAISLSVPPPSPPPVSLDTPISLF